MSKCLSGAVTMLLACTIVCTHSAGESRSTGESKRFRVTIKEANLHDSVQYDEDEGGIMGSKKTMTINAPKGRKFLIVTIHLDVLAWGKVQNPNWSHEGTMIPGVRIKRDWFSIRSRGKRKIRCAYIGWGFEQGKMWKPEVNREILLIRGDDGKVTMVRKVGRGAGFCPANPIQLIFPVSKDAGPFQLKFADVDPLDVSTEK